MPNDVRFTEAERVLLVTGPNMAGKSTILRQIGLCVVLAQIGAFVPAEAASIGVVDRLFTRVGASDNLAARPVHLHGGDERDQRDPAQRRRPEPGSARRDRPGHLDLRRRRHRLGGHRAPARPDRLQDDVRHPLPRADAAAGAAPARPELQRGGPGDRGDGRVPPPSRAGRHRPLLRHPCRPARRAARRGRAPGARRTGHAGRRASDGARIPAAARALVPGSSGSSPMRPPPIPWSRTSRRSISTP